MKGAIIMSTPKPLETKEHHEKPKQKIIDGMIIYQLGDAHLMFSSDKYDHYEALDRKCYWTAKDILSLHLSSGEKAIPWFINETLPRIYASNQLKSSPGKLITTQGDFNIDFSSTGLIVNKKDNTRTINMKDPGIESFLHALKTARSSKDGPAITITIDRIAATPDFRINKMRGVFGINAQAWGKANLDSITQKDLGVVLNFTPASDLNAEQTAERMRKHEAAVDELYRMAGKDRVTLEDIPGTALPVKNFPKKTVDDPDGTNADHRLTMIELPDGTLSVKWNAIGSSIPENTFYAIENQERFLTNSNLFSNFQWRYLINSKIQTAPNSPEEDFLPPEIKKTLFGDVPIETIDFNDPKKTYRIGKKELTGVQIRTSLEMELRKRWMSIFQGKYQIAIDPNTHEITAEPDAVTICRSFVRKFYEACFASPEFKAYNDTFIKPYGKTELEEIISHNVGNDKTLKAYMNSGPSKVMTYSAMGGVLDPVTSGADRDHKGFIHQLCIQLFNGFSPPPEKTQEGIDISQVRDALHMLQKFEGSDKVKPISSFDLIECSAGSHSELFFDLNRRIMVLSQKKALKDIDFDTDVLGYVLTKDAEKHVSPGMTPAFAQSTLKATPSTPMKGFMHTYNVDTIKDLYQQHLTDLKSTQESLSRQFGETIQSTQEKTVVSLFTMLSKEPSAENALNLKNALEKLEKTISNVSTKKRNKTDFEKTCATMLQDLSQLPEIKPRQPRRPI